MSQFSLLLWSAFVLAAVGCLPSPNEHGRPLAEPVSVDHPDLDAIATVSRELEQSNPPNSVAACDWPALFGAQRTSVSSSKVNPVWPSDGPKLIWETKAGTGYGSPVAAADRVVFSSRFGDEEIVQCHDLDDGIVQWQYRYPTSAVCDFRYSDGPYSTPIIDVDHRRVFNVGGQGQFLCLDLDSGNLLWCRDLHTEYAVPPDIFPVGASPLLDRQSLRPGGQLIFNLGASDCAAGVISLDPQTGQTRWQATELGPSYGTPFVATIHDQRFVFVLTDQGLVSLNPDDGSEDWFFEFRRKGDLARNATSPLVAGDRVLIASAGLGGTCLRIQADRSFTQQWHKRRTIDSQYNTLMLGDRHVYGFTAGGQGGAELRCIDLATGDLAWRYHSVLRRGMGLATPDAMLLLGEQGHLASLVFSPEAPRVLSFTDSPLMSGPCYCSPAIHGSRLILKDERRVAVFDLGLTDD